MARLINDVFQLFVNRIRHWQQIVNNLPEKQLPADFGNPHILCLEGIPLTSF